MEVMVAVAILATGVTVMLSGLLAQHQGRSTVRDTQRVTEVVSALKERIFSEPWTATTTTPVRGLGVSSWSTPGTFSLTTPFTGTGAHSESDLIAAGIMAQPTGMKDLTYYLEYYRADTLSATQKGLFDKGVDSNNDKVYDRFTSEAESRNGVIANLATAQKFTSAPTASIGTDEPLAIRIVVVWRGSSALGAKFVGTSFPGAQYYELFLAREAN